MDGDDDAEAFHAVRWCDKLSRLSVYGAGRSSTIAEQPNTQFAADWSNSSNPSLHRWGLCIWKRCYEILSNCSSILQLPRLRRRDAWAIFSRHETFSLRRSGAWSNGAVGYCLKLSCEVLSTVREGSLMSRLALVKAYYSPFPYHNCVADSYHCGKLPTWLAHSIKEQVGESMLNQHLPRRFVWLARLS